MKIYKIAIDTQMVVQNPAPPNDTNITLQNMQNAFTAIGAIDEIIAAAENVNTSIDNLEAAVGVTESGLKQTISNAMSALLIQNPSVNLLMKMNLLPSIEALFDSNKYTIIKTKITNDLQDIQSQAATAAQQTAVPNP